MAASGRRPPASLIEELRASPERFDFFQAVRIVERAALAAARDPRFAKPGRVGFDSDPRGEILFLRAVLELGFPATEVTAFDEPEDQRPELTVAVMGLNGPSGVLPGHYSQLVMETLREKNTALRDFLDLFNHRALSLFVRAMEKYRLALAYESAGHEDLDTVSNALYALIGMNEPALRRRQAVPDATLLFYSGHLSRATRPAGALGQILSDYFERPVTIAQFQGRWVSLPESEQTRLGVGSRGNYAQLGVSSVIGSRMWDVQGSFRVRLGPLDYPQFLDFMPDGPQMAELAALTRTYVGPALSFDVQLTLQAKEIPPLKLSNDLVGGPRLGWNTWLPTEYFRRDASDAIFRVESI